MSENQPEQTPSTEVKVEGDAVVNNAPDGGGVDNNTEGQSSDGNDGNDDNSK